MRVKRKNGTPYAPSEFLGPEWRRVLERDPNVSAKDDFFRGVETSLAAAMYFGADIYDTMVGELKEHMLARMAAGTLPASDVERIAKLHQ
jgi:hypothetical protein